MAQKGGLTKGMTKQTSNGGFASKPTSGRGVGAPAGAKAPSTTNPRLAAVRASDAKAIKRGARNGPDK